MKLTKHCSVLRSCVLPAKTHTYRTRIYDPLDPLSFYRCAGLLLLIERDIKQPTTEGFE